MLIAGWRGAAIIAVTSVLFAQDRPTLDVRLDEADGGAPAVAVRLQNLLTDRRFLRAMHSGFPMYVEYTVEVRESRSNWFDRSVAMHGWEFVVLHDPVRETFVVEDGRTTTELLTEGSLADYLARVYLLQELAPEGDGTFYYFVTVSARTLSDADVDEVFDWLKGNNTDSTAHRSRSILTRTARRLLVRVAPLPRVTISERSARFQSR